MSNLAETYIPFDTGPGATATTARWRSMSRGFRYNGIVPGFANQFTATISAGVLAIQPGAVWVDGFYAETTTNHTVSSTGLGPGLTVLRADPVARTIAFFYLPAVTVPNQPAPALSTGVYEIPLYYVVSQTTFNDVRQFATATNDNCRAPASNGPYNNSNYCARGRMWRSGSYGTSTAVNNYGFDTVSYGAAFFSGWQFVCPYSDDYLVVASVGFISSAVGQWYNARIARGASVIAWSGTTNASAVGATMNCQVQDIVPCKAGDTLYVQHWCSTNGLQGSVGQDRAYFSVRSLSR